MKQKGYKLKATVFCSRNDIKDSVNEDNVKTLCEHLAKNNISLVNGGGHTGNMNKCITYMHKFNGESIGIGLHKYEPTPNPKLTHWEAYENHSQRQSRLVELGDIYIALTGGLGTLHEVLDIHILQLLEEVDHPIILIGEHARNYQKMLDFLEHSNMLHKLPSKILFAKDSHEATEMIDKYFKKLQTNNYHNKTYYPALPAEDIYTHIKQNQKPYYILFEGLKMKVNPNVYPSTRFRSSLLLAKIVREMSTGKKVADIACGHGTMGLVAVDAGAKHVVQVDINPAAVENAEENRKLLNFEDKIDLYEGDVFEPLSYRYKNYFDIIFFNPPFHRNTKFKHDKLMYAFYTQGNEGGVIEKFLKRAHYYLSDKGEIIIGFSNKDPQALEYLETTMQALGYEYKVHTITNQKTSADNRVYSVKYLGEKKTTKNKPIKICALVSNAGLSKNDGQLFKNGINLAHKELKLEGINVELGMLDDKSSSLDTIKQTIHAVEKFKPDSFIGPTWSYLIDSVSPVLEEAKIPYFTPATSTDMLNSPTQFMLSGTQNIETKEDEIVFWLKKNLIKNFVYIYRFNKWANLHINLYKQICNELNINFISIQTEAEDKSQEIVKQFNQLTELAISIDNYEDNTFEIFKELKKQNISAPILLNLSLSRNLEKEIFKLEPGNPLFKIEAPIPLEFIERYTHAYPGQKISRYAFNAYAGMHILAHGLSNTTKENLKHYLIEGLPLIVSNEIFCYKNNGDLRQNSWLIERI